MPKISACGKEGAPKHRAGKAHIDHSETKWGCNLMTSGTHHALHFVMYRIVYIKARETQWWLHKGTHIKTRKLKSASFVQIKFTSQK